jgi:HSP20 family protein
MKQILIFNDLISPFNVFENSIIPEFFEYENSELEENITTTPFEYKINIELPQFRKKNIKITLDNNYLVVKGYKKQAKNSLFSNNYETSVTSFDRSYELTEDMDVEKVKAKFKNGLLTIIIPKKKEFITFREVPVLGSNNNNIIKPVTSDKSLKSKFLNLFKKVA